MIEALKDRNRDLKAREMYQTWLEERGERTKQVRENSKLLDEINELNKKLLVKGSAKGSSILVIGKRIKEGEK